MATITAASITTGDSLDTFRRSFNTLRSDIQGLSFGAEIVFEGTTADDFETTLSITDPTADRTVTIQDKSGIIALTGRDINDVVVLNATDGSGTDEASAIILNASAAGVDVGDALLYEIGTGDHIVNPVLQIAGNFVFEGSTDDAFETTLAIIDPTADRTITLQNKTGTVALQGRDIDDVITLNGTDANGANESSVIILDGDATSVDGVVQNIGEALLYEEGTNDHILNPTFEGVEEFIILEESLEGTPSFALRENVDSSSLDARFAYQPATSDNLLGALFLVPAAGGVQFTMPVNDGINDQVLATDGAGGLSFKNQSSGMSLGNDGNNRVITATGSGSGNGEANLNFNGSALAVTGTVTASGFIKTDSTTDATSTTDGSLQTDGGLSVALDTVIGNDVILISDASVIHFGVNSDVSLTHVHDTGLLLNAAMVVQFRDSAINIGSPADGDLDINADDEIELNSTLIDINGNVEISGTLAQADAITMATNKKIIFRDTAIHISSTADGDLSIAADDEIDLTSTLIDINGNVDISGTALVTGIATFSARPVFNASITIQDGGSIGSTSDLNALTISSGGVVAVTATTASTNATTGALTVAGGAGIAADLGIGDDLCMISDGSYVYFGANKEVFLFHRHDTGLMVSDGGAFSGTDGDGQALVRRGGDVLLVMDQSAAAGTDAGDNILLDGTDGDSANEGDNITMQNQPFLHAGMQRNVIEIRDSGGNLLNSIAGFAPGAI
jgi:hypothetical protein